MNKKTIPNPIQAVRSQEGFIEIVSIDSLNDIVGGMLSPESIYCQIDSEGVTQPLTHPVSTDS